MTGAIDPGILDGGLPLGTVELARQLLASAGARLAAVGGSLVLGAGSVEELLVLPRLVEPDWPEPSPPRLIAGGAVQADLTDDDREVFEALLRTLPGAGPEEVAATAQEWRLPVTPYRPLPVPVPGRPDLPRWGAASDATAVPAAPEPGRQPVSRFRPGVGASPVPGPGPRPEGGVVGARVLDLTTLWAGPLCTELLARHGAEVTKVDPDCRPDGFREHPALYQRLNGTKAVVDLDLRRPADRARFEDLVRRSDLLVASFSRRVLPNLGYGPDELRALNPQLVTLRLTAFPVGCPEQDWLAYGSGVHAASGLGMVRGRPSPPPIAYPDPLAGLLAFGLAVSLLTAPRAPGRSAEVSLADAVAPLVRRAAQRAGGLVPVGAHR